MTNLLNAFALADKYQMGFGGMVRRHESTVSEQGVNFSTLLDSFFGAGAASELQFRTNTYWTKSVDYLDMKLHRPFAFELSDEGDFQRRFEELKPGDHVHVWGVNLHNYGHSLVGWFPESLQATLAARLAEKPLSFAPGRRTVAIHARRGDLEKDDPRATTTAYYLRIVEAVRNVEPDADIHVWSSTKGRGVWKSEDFDGFRSRGIMVHLDDEDMLDPWAHMSRADVLVMSLSHYSYTPAVLNRNCVVYPDATVDLGQRPAMPPNWINACDIDGLKAMNDIARITSDDVIDGPMDSIGDVEITFESSNSTIFEGRLRECLDRVRSSSTRAPCREFMVM